MNREDIIRMAREAGYQHPDAVGQCEDFAYFSLERFAQLVAKAAVEHEREACAVLCDDPCMYGPEGEWCAAAIRDRSKKR